MSMELSSKLNDICDYFNNIAEKSMGRPNVLAHEKEFEGEMVVEIEAWGNNISEMPICIIAEDNGDFFISPDGNVGVWIQPGVNCSEDADTEEICEKITEYIRDVWANEWSFALDVIEFVDDWREELGLEKIKSSALKGFNGNETREI